MITPDYLRYALFVVTAAAVVFVIARPGVTATRGGKILAFLVLLVLPLICVGAGTAEHIEQSKKTEFCLSCHIMEPYGRSLNVDDPAYLAASHYQNKRVPRDSACYTCHTDYVIYGDLRAKMRGLRHVYAQYIGTPAKPVKLYSAYNNRECLHCHQDARSFEESPMHMALRDDLVSNTMSCLTSGCHDTMHKVESLGEVKMWKSP